MSLRANIEHLAAAQGIVAVAVDSPTATREFRGESAWRPILDTALALLKLTDEKTIRLVIGKHTIVLQTENEETVGVVLPTGHSIAKSLRRMIRRMSKKDRGPLRATPPTEAPRPPGTTPAAPQGPTGPNPSHTPPWGS